MKPVTIILLLIGLFSCTHKILQQSSFDGKCYESAKGHLFSGNEICFYPDNKFTYLGHGPSIFISEGKWKYEESKGEIELASISFKDTSVGRTRVDTMWLDLTGKRIKIKNNRHLSFEGIVYELK